MFADPCESVQIRGKGLRQIEQQDFGVFRAFDSQLLLVADGGAVALIQLLAIQLD